MDHNYQAGEVKPGVGPASIETRYWLWMFLVYSDTKFFPMAKQLQLKITDVAKQRIRRYLEETGFADPLPGLLLSAKTKGAEGKWYIGAYPQNQARDLERILASKGYVLRYEADGIDLLVPQPQLVAQLDGKTLDYQGDHYIVL